MPIDIYGTATYEATFQDPPPCPLCGQFLIRQAVTDSIINGDGDDQPVKFFYYVCLACSAVWECDIFERGELGERHDPPCNWALDALEIAKERAAKVRE